MRTYILIGDSRPGTAKLIIMRLPDGSKETELNYDEATAEQKAVIDNIVTMSTGKSDLIIEDTPNDFDVTLVLPQDVELGEIITPYATSSQEVDALFTLFEELTQPE